VTRYNPALTRHIREMREIVLDLLDAAYPITVREGELVRGLADATMPRPQAEHQTLRDLEYLAGLGLIERGVVPDPADESPVVRWTLSAKGKLFCERGKPWDRVEAL
jgi:hypothetical protein